LTIWLGDFAGFLIVNKIMSKKIRSFLEHVQSASIRCTAGSHVNLFTMKLKRWVLHTSSMKTHGVTEASGTTRL